MRGSGSYGRLAASVSGGAAEVQGRGECGVHVQAGRICILEITADGGDARHSSMSLWRTHYEANQLCCRMAPRQLEERCKHDKAMWIKPSTGEKQWSARPPLKGKEWYIPIEQWDHTMLKSSDENRKMNQGLPYLTSGAQAYPANLNLMLAEWLLESTKLATTTEDEYVKVWRWKLVRKRKMDEPEQSVTTRQKMTFTNRNRGKARAVASEDDEPKHLGGMRNPRKAVHRFQDIEKPVPRSMRHWRKP